MNRSLRAAFCLTAAAFALSGCATSDRVAQLESENERLRAHLGLNTAMQMRQIGMYAVIYAESNDMAFPTKPSDLREILESHDEYWLLFLAPYDRDSSLISTLNDHEDPWAWIDANGSFEFRDAEPFEHKGELLVERRPVQEGIRWTVFGDGHAEAVEISS